MDFAALLLEILFCDARDIAGDAIFVLVSIHNFDYLLQGLPSVAVFAKYAFKFFTFFYIFAHKYAVLFCLENEVSIFVSFFRLIHGSIIYHL